MEANEWMQAEDRGSGDESRECGWIGQVGDGCRRYGGAEIVKAVPCRSRRLDLGGKAPEMRTLAKLLVTP